MANENASAKLAVNQLYDTQMYHPLYKDFYNGTEFANHGYWDDSTPTAAQACLRLMEKLLAYMPANPGRILDVACGKGATTRYLCDQYPAAEVVGVNISEKQLASGREVAPRATFLLMDATQLDFPDSSFDAILCVEAAFHFNTRRRFFEEARRILKPGGRLVLSDALGTLEAERIGVYRYEENFVPTLEAYGDVLRECGFVDVEIEDATVPCWHNYFMYVIDKYHRQFLAREITREQLQEALSKNYVRAEYITYYPLAAATKPA